jgi:hypothetical protein
MAPQLGKRGIGVIMVYVNEAHSSAWPMGMVPEPAPHGSMDDRLEHVHAERMSGCPFPIYTDTWDNTYDNMHHVWPDGFILVGAEFKILMRSTYTHVRGNAVIDVDCIDVLAELLK